MPFGRMEDPLRKNSVSAKALLSPLHRETTSEGLGAKKGGPRSDRRPRRIGKTLRGSGRGRNGVFTEHPEAPRRG